jgi:parallel beta-helix repeat protein
MKNSYLSYAGWADTQGQRGLELSTTVTNFSGNTLENNYYGLYISSSNNNISSNNIHYNNYYGLTLSYSNNNTISDNNIDMNSQRNLRLEFSNNNTISNNNITSPTGLFSKSLELSLSGINNISNNTISVGYEYAVDINGGGSYIGDNKISYNKIFLQGDSSKGIRFSSSNNNTVYKNEIYDFTVSYMSATGMLFIGSKDNIVIDSLINVTEGQWKISIKSDGSTSNNTLLNTTFNKSNVQIDNGIIYVKWYLDVNVTNLSYSPIYQANVSAWDNYTSNLAFSKNTSIDGMIERQNLTEYFQNSSGKFYYTNYTISTAKEGYATDSTALNITNSTILHIILIRAQLIHSIQIRLILSNTYAKVYIPGIGEYNISTLPNNTYVKPSHYYLDSYLNNMLIGLVYSMQNPLSISTNSSGSNYTLGLNQSLDNSMSFIVFTKNDGGNWRIIDKRIDLIETGKFLAHISPSFSFGLGYLYPIKILLDYENIDIIGKEKILQKGHRNLIIGKNGTVEGKPAIYVDEI